MEREGPQTGQNEEDGAPESNVVRLPLDWLGPREDLVPFGPRAVRSELPSADRTDAGVPPSVHDFWGEDSAAMHDAVQGPTLGAGGPGTAFEPEAGVGRGPAINRGRTWPRVRFGSLRASRTASLFVVGVLGIAALLVVAQALSGGFGNRVSHRIAGVGKPILRATWSTSGAGLFPNRHFVARQRPPSRSSNHRAAHRPPANPHPHPAGAQPTTGSVVSVAPATPSAGYTADVPATASVQATASSTSSSAAGPSAAQSSGSAGAQPFGLGGSLGPGHSPNG